MELRRKRAPSPQKPISRLQPSEPLHMTTRAASKAGSATSGSRRGSLVSNGHTSPSGSHEDDNQRQSKRRKMSTGSKTTPTRASQSSHSLSTASRPSTRSMSSGNLPPIAETPTMTRKRKRSSGSTADNIVVASSYSVLKAEQDRGSDHPPEAKKQSGRNAKRSSTSSEEGRTLRSNDPVADKAQMDLNKANETYEHERENDEQGNRHDGIDESMEDTAIGSSTQSERAMDDELDVASADLVAAVQTDEYRKRQNRNRLSNASEMASDDHGESIDGVNKSANDESMEQGDDAEDDVEEANEDDATVEDDADDDPQELTASLETVPQTMDPTPVGSAQPSPAGSPPDSSFEQDSPVKRAVTSVPGDMGTDSVKGKKKLPGRRRAPHSNPKVEAALRRQLHLRMNYRAVAKALKPILAELGHRSLRTIESTPTAYEGISEYTTVKEGLHHHFENRLAWLQKQKELSKQRLDDMFKAEMEMRRTQYENVSRNIREQHVIRLQHDFLNAIRRQEQDEDGNASDEENGDVIPPLRHVTAKGTLSQIMGPEYHWRSRPAVEIERLFDEMYQRHEVVRNRRDHHEMPNFEDSQPFTTFDPSVREQVSAAKKLELLMRALEEGQHVPAIPLPSPIPNSEAVGLQALANASAASAATEAAMREAEERAKVQAEAAAKMKKDQDEREQARPNPLVVPKPSLSQTPEAPPSATSTSAPNAPTSVPTPVQTPRKESEWEPPKADQPEVQEQPPHPPSRSITSFSQVTMGPSLTETAPLPRIPGLGNHTAPPPQPIIPGLSLIPQHQHIQIPGLSMLTGFASQRTPAQSPPLRDPSVPRSVPSSTPLVNHATPASIASTPARSEEQRQSEQRQSEQQQYEQQQTEQRRAEQRQYEQQQAEQRQAEQRQYEQQQYEQQQAEQRQAEQRQYEQQQAEYRQAEQRRYEQQQAEYRQAEQRRYEQQQMERRQAEQRQAEQRQAERESVSTAPFVHPSTETPSHSRPKDFWSSLARGAQDNGTSKARSPPQDASEAHSRETTTNQGPGQESRGVEPYPLDKRPSEEVHTGRPLDGRVETDPLGARLGDQGQQRQSEIPLDPLLVASQDRASSRAPSIASATALEPLSQRLRSTSDSHGGVEGRDDASRAGKGRAPKTSLYGPWPRGRNYDPYKHDRRASTTAVVSQEDAASPYYGSSGGYGTPDGRHASYTPAPHYASPFPTSAPPGGYHPVPPYYAPAPPPPYSYDQRPVTYQQSPYGPPPAGYSGMGGPGLAQGPPPSPYYGVPPPPSFQGPATAYAPPLPLPLPPPPPAPPALASRPPSSQPAYGRQYGGQPILPAGGHKGSGSTNGSPASTTVAPVFAQYTERHGEFREAHGRGRGRGPHSEWKHYQPR